MLRMLLSCRVKKISSWQQWDNAVNISLATRRVCYWAPSMFEWAFVSFRLERKLEIASNDMNSDLTESILNFFFKWTPFINRTGNPNVVVGGFKGFPPKNGGLWSLCRALKQVLTFPLHSFLFHPPQPIEKTTPLPPSPPPHKEKRERGS